MYVAVWRAASHVVPRTWSLMKSPEDASTQRTVSAIECFIVKIPSKNIGIVILTVCIFYSRVVFITLQNMHF